MRFIINGCLFSLFVIAFICLFPIECVCQKKDRTSGNHTSNSFNTKQISYKLIPSTNNTWGYDIFIDDKLTVHQPARPAMTGTRGFNTKMKAQTVAKMVIAKLKKGEMPPTVSVDELKKAGAL